MTEISKQVNVFDVAYYLLDKMGPLTTMKLQKMAYYSQAWSLVWEEEPLFKEDFQAWANGPVCRNLYDIHKGKFKVNKEDFEHNLSDAELTAAQKETIDLVIESYGKHSGVVLSDLTHREMPWLNARKGTNPGDISTEIIKKENIQEYYGSLVEFED